MEKKSALEITLIDLFYDYMASDHVEEFDGKEVEDTTLTPVDLLHQQTVNALEETKQRIETFEKAIKKYSDDETKVETLKKHIQPLLDEEKHFKNSSMEYMKKLYEETKDTSYSRNEIIIPVYNRFFHHTEILKDNSKYNVGFQYLFYDNLGVLNGKSDQYKELKPSQRKQFIKDNTEITHIALIVNDVSIVAIKGELIQLETPIGLDIGLELFKAVPCTK